MIKVYLETERLLIAELSMDMAEVIQRNSLDDDNRRFVPDEVFETVEEARETVACLIEARHTETGPFVFALILKKDGSNIGYVQTCRTENEWEIGYHIAKAYAGNGYATEAVCAFAPVVIRRLKVSGLLGIALAENHASCRVLEKCGFTLLFSGMNLYQGQPQMIRKYWFEA